MSARRLSLGFGLVAISAALTACPGTLRYNPERLPSDTAIVERTPVPIETVSKAELHARMRALADHAAEIDALLRSAKPPRTAVVMQLSQMEVIALSLSDDDARSIHPMLWKNIELFRRDLASARRAAEQEPPNYFLAGTVAGACGYCHGPGMGKVN
jgi:hypothetical protein